MGDVLLRNLSTVLHRGSSRNGTLLHLLLCPSNTSCTRGFLWKSSGLFTKKLLFLLALCALFDNSPLLNAFQSANCFVKWSPPPLSSLFWCVISLSCLVVFLFLHLPKQSRPLSVPHKGVFQLTTMDILCARCIQNNTVLSFGSFFLVHYSMAQLSVNALWSPIYQLKRKRSGSLLF